MTHAKPRRWLQYLIWLPIDPDVAPEDYRSGILALRQIEEWLRDNHAPRPLFDKHGRPKSGLVCVSFEENELEKALAYRNFCTALGLGRSLRQNYIVDNLAGRMRTRN